LGRRVKEEDLPEGSFDKCILKESAAQLPFALEASPRDPYNPSTAVVSLLTALTGWNLVSFSLADAVGLRKHTRMKFYGSADVMVWVKATKNQVFKQLTIRLKKDERQRRWLTGSLMHGRAVTHMSEQSLVATVQNISRGDLLDIRKMAAADPVPINRSQREKRKSLGYSSYRRFKLVLTFATSGGTWESLFAHVTFTLFNSLSPALALPCCCIYHDESQNGKVSWCRFRPA